MFPYVCVIYVCVCIHARTKGEKKKIRIIFLRFSIRRYYCREDNEKDTETKVNSFPWNSRCTNGTIFFLRFVFLSLYLAKWPSMNHELHDTGYTFFHDGPQVPIEQAVFSFTSQSVEIHFDDGHIYCWSPVNYRIFWSFNLQLLVIRNNSGRRINECLHYEELPRDWQSQQFK